MLYICMMATPFQNGDGRVREQGNLWRIMHVWASQAGHPEVWVHSRARGDMHHILLFKE